MYKAVFCLDRKEGMDHEEFREYWTTDHAALADDVPNVVKYTVSFPADPDDAAYDGMATLYYESHEALQDTCMGVNKPYRQVRTEPCPLPRAGEFRLMSP